MGSIGSFYANGTAARSALRQGEAVKSAYYQSARNKETEARGANSIAARNMMTMRRNQSAATAAMRVRRGTTNLTSEGTGAVAEQSIAERYGRAVKDQMISAAVNDKNLRYAATKLRWEGDAAMTSARNKAEAAKAAQKGALVQLGVEVATAAIGGAAGAGWSWSGAGKGLSLGGTATSWLPGATGEWNKLGMAMAADWADRSGHTAAQQAGNDAPSSESIAPIAAGYDFGSPVYAEADGVIPPWLQEDDTGAPQVEAGYDTRLNYAIPDEMYGDAFNYDVYPKQRKLGIW